MVSMLRLAVTHLHCLVNSLSSMLRISPSLKEVYSASSTNCYCNARVLINSMLRFVGTISLATLATSSIVMEYSFFIWAYFYSTDFTIFSTSMSTFLTSPPLALYILQLMYLSDRSWKFNFTPVCFSISFMRSIRIASNCSEE